MTNYIPIVAFVLFWIALLLTSFLYHSAHDEKKTSHEIISNMTLDAFFIAIIALMTFVPNMGYLAVTPFVSLTLLHLPVLLGAAIGGWKKGLLLGLVFGVSSYVQALSSTGFNALFAYPWVAIPPRMLFGLLAGIVFSLLGTISKKRLIGLYLGLACALLTAIHTGLVFLDLYIFYPDTISGLFSSSSPIALGTALTFTSVIGLGVLGEMGVAAVIVPPLYLASCKVLPRFKKRKHQHQF